MDPREGEGTTDSAARGSHKGGCTSPWGRKLCCDKEPVGGLVWAVARLLRLSGVGGGDV